MIIVIDLRPLLGGNKSGVEVVTEQLVDHLVKMPGNTYVLFINAWKNSGPLIRWKGPNIIQVNTRIPNKLFNFFLIFLRRPHLDTLIFKRTGLKPDIFFLPDLRPAPVKRAKKFLLVHDLAFHHFPKFFSIKSKIWYRFINPYRQIKSCDHLFAVSDYTKLDLIKTLAIDENKITILPNAVDKNFGKNIMLKELEEVQKKYMLPKNFFLFLGTVEPRKNIEALIQAFRLFLQQNQNKDFYLIIAGKQRPDIFKKYHINESEKVFCIGSVEEKDKSSLYMLATALVYPSIWEGFGLPVLEAMKCGTPVITSNVSGLIETGGDAVIAINPHDISGIAKALQLVLEPQVRQELKEKMGQHVKKFSWQHSAEKLLKTFEKVPK